MTTDDDGSSPWSSGPLEDTPEMKRILETIRTNPAVREKLRRLMEAVPEEHAASPGDMAPDEDEVR